MDTSVWIIFTLFSPFLYHKCPKKYTQTNKVNIVFHSKISHKLTKWHNEGSDKFLSGLESYCLTLVSQSEGE